MYLKRGAKPKNKVYLKRGAIPKNKMYHTGAMTREERQLHKTKRSVYKME